MAAAGVGQAERQTHGGEIGLDAFDLVGFEVGVYGMAQRAGQLPHQTAGLAEKPVFGRLGGTGDHDRIDAPAVEQCAEHLADQHRERRRRAEPRARGQGAADLDIGAADLDPELGKGRGHAAHQRFGRAELRRAHRQMVKPNLKGLEALGADTEKPAVVRLVGGVEPQIHA